MSSSQISRTCFVSQIDSLAAIACLVHFDLVQKWFKLSPIVGDCWFNRLHAIDFLQMMCLL